MTTKDEALQMALDAGFPFNKYGLLQGDDDGEIDTTAMLVRFAALVAAAEREKCAAMVEPLDESLAEAIRARGNT